MWAGRMDVKTNRSSGICLTPVVRDKPVDLIPEAQGGVAQLLEPVRKAHHDRAPVG